MLKPLARTTRPNVMPRFRSTTMPGSSNAVVTGKAGAVDSRVPALLVVSVMQGQYTAAGHAVSTSPAPDVRPCETAHAQVRGGAERAIFISI